MNKLPKELIFHVIEFLSTDGNAIITLMLCFRDLYNDIRNNEFVIQKLKSQVAITIPKITIFYLRNFVFAKKKFYKYLPNGKKHGEAKKIIVAEDGIIREFFFSFVDGIKQGECIEITRLYIKRYIYVNGKIEGWCVKYYRSTLEKKSEFWYLCGKKSYVCDIKRKFL